MVATYGAVIQTRAGYSITENALTLLDPRSDVRNLTRAKALLYDGVRVAAGVVRQEPRNTDFVDWTTGLQAALAEMMIVLNPSESGRLLDAGEQSIIAIPKLGNSLDRLNGRYGQLLSLRARLEEQRGNKGAALVNIARAVETHRLWKIDRIFHLPEVRPLRDFCPAVSRDQSSNRKPLRSTERPPSS